MSARPRGASGAPGAPVDVATPSPAPVREVLRAAIRRLDEAGVPEPALDASLLVAHVLGCAREELICEPARPVPPTAARRLEELVARRARFEPVAYLRGVKEFYGVELAVRPGVLVPRPDTECLLEAACAAWPAAESVTVLDVGTGSGCLAALLVQERPRWRVLALDVSAAALQVACENAPGAALIQADLTAPIRAESLDLLVGNPPYLDPTSREELPPDLAHEPEEALFGEGDGTGTLARLLADAPRVLRPGGRILLEHGADQGSATRTLAGAAGLVEVETGRDLAGRERYLSARRAGETA